MPQPDFVHLHVHTEYSIGESAIGIKRLATLCNEVGVSAARGVDTAQASVIFDRLAESAPYGFNKGHAAAYATIAYQTAWLKANHPLEFKQAWSSTNTEGGDWLWALD